MSSQLISRLWRPLVYLTIRHDQKTWYDYWLPVLFALISAGAYGVLPKSIPLVADKGLLSHIQELVKILAGFYIAALAAVATFDRPGMDSAMSGRAPQIYEIRGETNYPAWHDVTRRRFLCYLFGYLAFVSLFLYCTTVAAIAVKPWVETQIWVGERLEWLRPLAALPILAVFWNMMITTMIGLYYLAERLHKADDFPNSDAPMAPLSASEEVKSNGEDEWEEPVRSPDDTKRLPP